LIKDGTKLLKRVNIKNPFQKIQETNIMRGRDHNQSTMFSYISPEARVPQDHPLRAIRRLVDAVLRKMSRRFAELYSHTGRPSIAPEKLLRALLLQVLFTIRSERQLMEQLDYNLLYRWFVGMQMDDPVWDATVFSKNRDRLLAGDIAAVFLNAVLSEARRRGLLSEEHFSVDGSLIEAWASQKSFKKKSAAAAETPDDPSNPTVDFHGEVRSNATHQSTTDPEARLYKKSSGAEAKLCYLGHALLDNRHGLLAEVQVTIASGTAERDAAKEMMKSRQRRRPRRRLTLGGDKNYDTRDFVEQMRKLKVTPHVAQNNKSRSSAIDERTTRHTGYDISQRKRKLVEEFFGWMKTVGLMRKTRHRGVEQVGWMFTITAAAYNLVRIKNLEACPC
jgi:transposase